MNTETFRDDLLSYLDDFQRILSTDKGEWTVKGFIDIRRNIYTISIDTKVASKIIELMLFPILSKFAAELGYVMVLGDYQNYYPDTTFIAPDGTKIALDLKSTYRIGPEMVNGFTLGAFTGYFRQRSSTKNISFPYEQYAKHFVLGIIYSRSSEIPDERRIYSLEELHNIISVVKDFTFVLQEKWRIASDQPGSGNTKNIGSIKSIPSLVSGNGLFAPYGKHVFDDYWMNYLTRDMARAIDSSVPYRNLNEYLQWRTKPGIL